MEKLPSNIIAIDAEDFSRPGKNQYDKEWVKREIVKAYAGISSTNENSEIVTGNWGCGIFRGDHQLKFMIQWIAGSLAGRHIVHCPYGEEKRIFANVNKEKFMEKIKGKKVEEIYNNLLEACTQKMFYGRNDLIETINFLTEEVKTIVETVPLAEFANSSEGNNVH